MENNKQNIFNKISFYTLITTFFLSIFFFIPYISIPIDAAKGFLISIGVIISTICWLIGRLIDGKFSIPKDRIIIIAALVPLVFLVSSFFSSSLSQSIFGHGFEVGTFSSTLILFLVLLLSSVFFQNNRNIKLFFRLFIIGTLVLGVFQLTQLFFGIDKFAPGLFLGVTGGNLLGSWSNFALMFGGVIILILTILEFIPHNKIQRILLSAFAVLALFLLTIVNIYIVWVLVGIFSLIIFVYSISVNRTPERTLKNFPYLSFFIVLISLLFIVNNATASSIVASLFGTINPEIYPSFTGTMNMVLPALKHNPFLGTGPNTFLMDWSLWKPALVTQSMFWNVDFQSGFATIPSYIITTGVLGIVSWVLLFVIFIMRSIQSLPLILKKSENIQYVILPMILAVFFWISAFTTNPNFVELVIMFAATGIFIGSLTGMNLIPVNNKSFLTDPRISFFSILSIVLLMIISISTCYVYVEKFSSIVYISTSSPKDLTTAELTKSEAKILRAISLDKNDIYYTNLSQIYLLEVQALMADKSLSTDTAKNTIQDRISNIEAAVSNSIKLNPKLYLNWKNAGDIYSTLFTYGIKGTYDNSDSAYVEALKLAPGNPGILLARAQLEVANKDTAKANTYIEEALKYKKDYTDAVFLRAQIKYDAGNVSGAITDAELAATMAPNDSSVYFRLGELKYNNGDTNGAISALEMAVRLNQNYHNARYLLAVAYKKAGRDDDSHKQFEILHNLFPENTEITDAFNGKIANLQSTTLDTKTPVNNVPDKGTTTTLPKKN